MSRTTKWVGLRRMSTEVHLINFENKRNTRKGINFLVTTERLDVNG